MSSILKLSAISVLVLLLAACAPGQPAVVATEAAGEAATEAVTEEATEAATEASTGGATVSVSTNMNCRSGPGSNFDLVYLMKAGESADILGTDANGQYWVIDSPEGECWLWNADALTSGDTSGLTAYASPPTPTPVPPPDWNGTWHIWMWQDPFGLQTTDFNVTMTQTGKTFYMQFPFGSYTFKFNGTVSDDGMYVTGRISTGTMSALPFTFHRNPDDLRQFSGIWKFEGTYVDLDFCGSKGGAPRPDPCRLH